MSRAMAQQPHPASFQQQQQHQRQLAMMTLSELELQKIHAKSSISELIQARQVQRTTGVLGGPAVAAAVDKDSDTGSTKDAAAARKVKQSRDPQSHRIIEKRRRDRMNQSLTDLSRLIPAAYLKQGQSRVEKAEIIELATQHIVALAAQIKKCEVALGADFPGSESACCIGKFYQGFREASKAAVAYLTEHESFSTNDPLCSKLRAHLHGLSQRLLPTDDAETTPTPTKAEPPLPEAGQSSSSPARSVSCSTDEARSEEDEEAAFGSDAAAAAAAAAAGRHQHRDPKSSFRARFEAEATSRQQQQQQQSLKRPRLSSPNDDKADDDEEAAGSPADCPRRSPGLDYRDRVRLLDRGDHASAADDRDDRDGPTTVFLPGFVLHESGTFYEPVVIPPASLGSERVSAGGGGSGGERRPLHPVSIPVNFRTTRFVRCVRP